MDRRRGLHRGTWERSGGKMTRSFFAALVGAIAIVLGGAPLSAQNAYITNFHGNTVSVIATATNTVVGLPIPVGTLPVGVAVTPDGSTVYVANEGDNTVSVIDTATNTVVGLPIRIGNRYSPLGIAAAPDGSKVYAANNQGKPVGGVGTSTKTSDRLPIQDGSEPYGIGVN